MKLKRTHKSVLSNLGSTPNIVVGKPVGFRDSKIYKKLIYVVSALIVIGLITAIYVVISIRAIKPANLYTSTLDNKIILKCDDHSENGILYLASGQLDPKDTTKLKDIVYNIENIKDFDKNPDCLNIVTTYYINISDYASSQKYLDKLNTVYDPSKGFSSVIERSGNAKTIESIRSDVTFLKQQTDNTKKNSDALKFKVQKQ